MVTVAFMWTAIRVWAGNDSDYHRRHDAHGRFTRRATQDG
jgi:hypothetical protein